MRLKRGKLAVALRVAAVAMLLGLFAPAGTTVQADGAARPRPLVGNRCQFPTPVPSPGSTVRPEPGAAVHIAVGILCSGPVGRVRVILDGKEVTFENPGRTPFDIDVMLAAPLDAGPHHVRVVVLNDGSFSWRFRVGESPSRWQE